MFATAAASFAFTGPVVNTKVCAQSRAAVSMGMDRRSLLQTAAGAAIAGFPLAAQVWILPASPIRWVVGALGLEELPRRASWPADEAAAARKIAW